jgi:transposase
VSRLHARVLLDTGPTDEDVREIEAAFRSVNMNADVEGHPFGGPPPSAFLIVVNVPLVAFLDSFFAWEHDGAVQLGRLARRLMAIRKEARRWGKPHDLKLEDATSSLGVLIPHDLPDSAYGALLEVDLSGFDRGSPPLAVAWNRRLGRWQALPSALARQVARRLPTRRSAAVAEPFGVREIDWEETRRLWRLADGGAGSVVTWQRAEIVLWSATGWSIAAIARKTLMSERRVLAVVRNFNLDGFASLALEYAAGQPAELTLEEEREVRRVARGRPGDYALPFPAWDPASLAEFLVTEGVVEDISPRWLGALLREPGVALPG